MKPKYKASVPVGWVANVLLNKWFINCCPPVKKSVAGFNKLLEEFISAIPALPSEKWFNPVAFFLKGRKIMFKGDMNGEIWVFTGQAWGKDTFEDNA